MLYAITENKPLCKKILGLTCYFKHSNTTESCNIDNIFNEVIGYQIEEIASKSVQKLISYKKLKSVPYPGGTIVFYVLK